MASFPIDYCYHTANTAAACIAFHTDNQHRRGFNLNQLIEFSLGPNPDADKDREMPPQMLSLVFSTADVVVLGWRLELLHDYLRDGRLAAIAILPKRYAELERHTPFVSGISIKAVGKE